jgi:transcriptional regulator with XRE-family HTH domain
MNDQRAREAYRVGRRIASRRTLLDWTADRLATEAGVSRVTISRLEQGRVGKTGAETLTKIAGALGVTVDWLLFGDAGDATAAEAGDEAEEGPAERPMARAA